MAVKEAILLLVTVGHILLENQCVLGATNIALQKPSSQSSSPSVLYGSKNGNDGNRNGNTIHGLSCAHTMTNDSTSWWMVDLGDNYTITAIGIMNRVDCCSGRFKNFSVEITVANPVSLKGFPGPTGVGECFSRIDAQPPTFQEYQCQRAVMGRYVRLTMPNNEKRPLNICELEVYGTLSISEQQLTNLAFKKTSWQSSEYRIRPYPAKNANDGNRDMVTENGSCSHTDSYDINPWWMVDLENTYKIAYIGILNRAECCSDRLKNFSVEVTMTNPRSLTGFPGSTGIGVCFSQMDPQPPKWQIYQCEKPVKGRYVRVIKPNKLDSPLTLCELEVYGYKIIKEFLKGRLSLWKSMLNQTERTGTQAYDLDDGCSLNDA